MFSPVIPFGDLHSILQQQLQPISHLGVSPEGIISHIQSTFPMSRFQRAMTHPSRFNSPEQHSAIRERLLEQSNIQRTASLNAAAMSRAILQFDFEELLKGDADGQDGKRVRLDDWCWVENLTKETLTQVWLNGNKARVCTELTNHGFRSFKKLKLIIPISLSSFVKGKECFSLPCSDQAQRDRNHIYLIATYR